MAQAKTDETAPAVVETSGTQSAAKIIAKRSRRDDVGFTDKQSAIQYIKAEERRMRRKEHPGSGSDPDKRIAAFYGAKAYSALAHRLKLTKPEQLEASPLIIDEEMDRMRKADGWNEIAEAEEYSAQAAADAANAAEDDFDDE